MLRPQVLLALFQVIQCSICQTWRSQQGRHVSMAARTAEKNSALKGSCCALKLCGVPFWHATKFGRISCKRQLALFLMLASPWHRRGKQRSGFTQKSHMHKTSSADKICSGNCRMSALKKPSPLHWSPFLLLLSPDMRPWRQLRGSSLLESLSVSAFSRLWPLHQKQVHLSDHCNVFLPDVTSIYTEFSEI